jgi:pre-mRNA-splicing factor SYF1
LLITLQLGTFTREAFDKALQSLPLTQHSLIWDLFIKWVKDFGVEEAAIRVYRRYIMFDPTKREEYIEYLLDISQFEEAIRQLSYCVNDDHFVSPSGQNPHQMWMKFCDLCANHPLEASRSIKVDAVIRSGISKFSDEVGRLWCRLANFYTRMGQFERSRDIYEEGTNSVVTVRDFTVIFDSYVKFEEGILTAKMRISENEDAQEDDEVAVDVELRLARLEFLLDKRPLLLNSVALRQNPHNVQEWHKRIHLLKDDTAKATVTYAEALKTIDSQKSQGKLSGLWLSFAHFYETHNDLVNARVVLKKASEVEYKSVDELAQIYCSWGEMELRHGQHNRALDILQEAVTEPNSSIKRRRAKAVAQGQGKAAGTDDYIDGIVSRDRLHKSVHVWSLYLDLEETFGSIESCRAAYERAFDLKVITPQMALNYASFLEERNFYEESFKAYEKAILLFSFPHVKTIWMTYLDRFISRYEGSKMERLRDLFEQAIAKVPTENAAEFYIKFAKTEESFGLLRHAVSIYDKATQVVPESSRLDMYRLYIKKVEQHFGLTKTRPIYERAVSELNDEMSRLLCLEFSEMERKLGEIDRARSILVHGAQFGDPRRELAYWKTWREFEEAHGNEDTFREMLRIQRSVETAFAQVCSLQFIY